MATAVDQLQYSIVNNEDVTPELDQAIRDGLVVCFPHNAEPYSKKRAWHSDPAWIVVARDSDGTVAGYMAAVERTVLVGPDTVPVRIAGLQGVFARPEWRKSGLTGHLMDIWFEEARKRGIEAGLLFCLHILDDKLYGKFGWTKAGNAIMLDEDGERQPIPEKNRAMTIPLNIDRFPDGDIFLNGRDW